MLQVSTIQYHFHLICAPVIQFNLTISLSAAPYFLKRDVNTQSPEYHKVKDGLDKLMFAPTPYMCCRSVPYDLAMFVHMLEVFYLSPFEMALSWNELNSSKHCSSVTRWDVETLAGSVAFEHSCDY